MAKPIRNTPILTGADARWFEREIANLPSLEERKAARQRMLEGARRFEEFLRKLKD